MSLLHPGPERLSAPALLLNNHLPVQKAAPVQLAANFPPVADTGQQWTVGLMPDIWPMRPNPAQRDLPLMQPLRPKRLRQQVLLLRPVRPVSILTISRG